MNEVRLTTVGNDASWEELLHGFERDGGVIVKNILATS